ncbi:hypothetical protein ACGTN6_17545 [Halomonas sp. THAF12]|uniref:hypothetical protein n=1 Tax=Halomonas sp. B23F22_10 TaxID=3459515 RepID=UPI00373F1785
MKITFWVTCYSPPETLANWLKNLGHQPEWLGDEEPGAMLNQETQAVPLLLGYHPPEIALQQAMQQGEKPQEAMERWAEQARRLINCFKANREAAVLIDLSDLHRAPLEGYASLMDYWSIEVERPESLSPLTLPSEAPDNDRETVEDVALKLLAREAVRQFPDWPDLSSQLEACSLPLVDSQVSLNGTNIEEDIESLFQSWQTEQQRRQATFDSEMASQQAALKDNAELKEENRLLLEQLHLVQEELENVLGKNQTLSKQLSALTGEKDALQYRFNESSTTVAQLNAQLEKRRKAHEQAAERMKQQEKHQNGQQRQLKELQQSHKSLLSQKETLDKQLASLQQAEKQRSAFEEENHLLLEQLHLVQEELERIIRASQDQQRRLDGEEQQRQELQESLEENEGKRQLLHQRLEQNEQMQNLLQRRLAKLRTVYETRARELSIAETRLAEQRAVERTRVLELAAVLQERARGEGRYARKALKREREVVMASGLFDRDWYLEHYPAVADSGMDPLTHYLKAGAAEGYNPSATFDTTWYLLTYHDVAKSGLNPLVHFIRFGRLEQRTPHPHLPALPAPAIAMAE